MSLFENAQSLCGNFRAENFKESIQKFFALSDAVKDYFRGNDHLLSEYLFTIFKSLDCMDISMAADRAENLCSEAVYVEVSYQKRKIRNCKVVLFTQRLWSL